MAGGMGREEGILGTSRRGRGSLLRTSEGPKHKSHRGQNVKASSTGRSRERNIIYPLYSL